MPNIDVINQQISYYEDQRQQVIDLRQKYYDKYANFVDSVSPEQFYAASCLQFISGHCDSEIIRITRILTNYYNILINI